MHAQFKFLFSPHLLCTFTLDWSCRRTRKGYLGFWPRYFGGPEWSHRQCWRWLWRV